MKKAPFIILSAVFLAAIVWFWYPIRSLSVMAVYSALHNKNSIMAENKFSLEIPGGNATIKRDWYPFVITFNADNYSARNGEINGMTILYNFPAFNPLTRTNLFYEINSPYSSSFYGAYIIKSTGPVPYCFDKNGFVNYDEVMHAFNYDYKKLVLNSLGTYDFIFEVESFLIEDTDYIGYKDWKKVDARIKTNSVTHSFSKPMQSYIQYGRPTKTAVAEFPETIMFGRFYIKYFPEISSTVLMYSMTPDLDVLLECDELLLSKSALNLNRK